MIGWYGSFFSGEMGKQDGEAGRQGIDFRNFCREAAYLNKALSRMVDSAVVHEKCLPGRTILRHRLAYPLAGHMNSNGTLQKYYSSTFHEGSVGERMIFQYVVHLERMPGVEIQSFNFVPTTDELEVRFDLSGYTFEIEMQWGGELVLRATQVVPKDIFQNILQHLSNLKAVSRKELAQAKERYRTMTKRKGQTWTLDNAD